MHSWCDACDRFVLPGFSATDRSELQSTTICQEFINYHRDGLCGKRKAQLYYPQLISAAQMGRHTMTLACEHLSRGFLLIFNITVDTQAGCTPNNTADVHVTPGRLIKVIQCQIDPSLQQHSVDRLPVMS